MPRVEAEAGELATRCGDVRVELAVEPLAAFGPRLQQTELLELPHLAPLDTCSLAELREIELRLVVAEGHEAFPEPIFRPR